jgi:hypothetical protein
VIQLPSMSFRLIRRREHSTPSLCLCAVLGVTRYERRTLEYRVGHERAVPVPAGVGDFYGMAAS